MFKYCMSREVGCRARGCLGETSEVQSSLASCMKAHHTWDPRKTVSDTDHGGVFNFDFSKNGSLLGVACERKSVLLFDPFNGKMVANKTNAHTDSVNCVKFLDDRLFATCSDDTTVALWDTRYLKHKVQVFRGHANWVKNIEYDANQGLLVTSGFDGCIYTWNINKYSNEECSSRVFYTSGLMRTKLSPDFTKLFISTHEGYIIAIHNLDLSTLGEDLKGFKPNMYRLMQRSGTPLRIGLMYNHLFVQERNRVEFIADWPTGNDANIISSIQVHPYGWCLLSRNTDSTENTEWTCVHDIQDEAPQKSHGGKQYLDVEPFMPHTSGAFCSSTYTPAFSSLAPSRRPQGQRSSESASGQHSGNAATSRATHIGEDEEEGDNEQVEEEEDERYRIVEWNADRGGIDDVERVEELSAGSHADTANGVHADTANGVHGNSVAEDSVERESNNLPVPEEEEVGAGHVHNSLIQIRRGPRNEDGQFSFSISVHTVTGQTINFNQSDLESDDDDDDDHEIAVEQIVGESVSEYLARTRRSETGQGQVDVENGIDGNDTVFGSARHRSDGSSSHEENSVTRDRLNNNATSSEEVDSDESDNDDNSDTSPNTSSGSDNSSNEMGDGSEVSRSSQRLPPVQPQPSSQLDPSPTERRRSNERFRAFYRSRISSFNIGRSDSTSSSSSRLSSSDRRQLNSQVSDSVHTVRDDTNSSSARPINSSPRSNTFMFVLQSGSGERTRRIMNLRYMDSYTPLENDTLQKKIHTNKNRLLGYVPECNVGRGFIKELAFSSDGRLFSSPFGFGLRLFAFDSHCNELCDCIPSSPVKLYEVTCSLAHVNCVVATKFSPTHNMVVSGCLDGKIAFHQPVL